METVISGTNRARFLSEYRKHLAEARAKNINNEYGWPESELENVYQRMVAAIDRESFNKNSKPFKQTCKALGIAHTYKAIREFIATADSVSCDQCQMLSINGTACHETGCPNSGARWDSQDNRWVKQRKCFDCGYTVDTEDPCCSEVSE